MWTQGQVPTRVDIHRSRSVSDKWRGVGFLQHRAIWLSGLWVEGRDQGCKWPKKKLQNKKYCGEIPHTNGAGTGGMGVGSRPAGGINDKGGVPLDISRSAGPAG